MKICVLLGTRPEIIKMAPIIRELEKRQINYFVIHSGQHYSYEMDEVFFQDLFLKKPKYNLEVGSGTHAQQTALILTGIEKILMSENPDIILVQGDTNTVLAGALAASKIGINIGHVEAGLRSYDRTMAEEINRVLTDHISTFLFAPTVTSMHNLLKEGISQDKIFITGNTIVDSINYIKTSSSNRESCLDKFNVEKNDYILVTIHRAENVDDNIRLKRIVKCISNIQKEYNLTILFPIHPRTSNMLQTMGLKYDNISFTKPIGYFDFITLEDNARLVITDSGGVQEETCILGTPCVTIRDNTERPETIDIGSNILSGTEKSEISKAIRSMLEKNINWSHPFGDGCTSHQIVQILLDN
ncbi:MAG: UDP-N-acetylglucosamine 2-epimerase (non-hydrolyzing) [Methanomicrobiales archaeon]|nr:UDP-N-acetylglucosamine 2-epimerase (non-hydrolyzing) [Methanomicrobiales archaeon]